MSRSKFARAPAAAVATAHQVADGMHGAIIKAVKTLHPETAGLPMVKAASSAGYC